MRRLSVLVWAGLLATTGCSDEPGEEPMDSGVSDAAADSAPSDAFSGDDVGADSAEPSDAEPSDAEPSDAEPSDAEPSDAEPSDAGLDASFDAAADAGTDGGPDGSTDAGNDSGADAATDAGVDAPMDAEIATPNYAFVTSMTVHPGQLDEVMGAGSGLEGADIVCNSAAAAAMLPGTYVAWLSTSTMDAIDRLSGARGWIRTDDTPFADTPDMFRSGAHWFPLNIDENGDPATGLVLTGTGANGLRSTANCGDWSNDATASAAGGSAAEMGRLWTSGKVPNCDGRFPVRLYCFGIDNDVQVDPPQAVGRHAFLSQGTFAVSEMGVDVADALCQSEATTAMLTGSFRALLALDGASAASRFDTTGEPWVRTDGIPVGPMSSFLMGQLNTSIHVHADGATYSSQAIVFTGANNPMSLGNMSSTCSDWAAAAGSAAGGSVLAPASFFNGFTPGCDRMVSVYCLQE